MKIEISTKLPEKTLLQEIYQSMTMKQALLKRLDDSHFERITPFVLCRDFLVDVYTFSKAKKDFQIYGMRFTGATESPDWAGVYLLIQFPNAPTKQAFFRNLPTIIQIPETLNSIPKTALYEVNSLESVICASPRWLASCLTLSLYTFLLRVCCYDFVAKTQWWKDFADLKNTDARYVASISPSTWRAIMADLSLLNMPEFCGFDPKKESVSTIHHNSGFISVFGLHSEINERAVRCNAHWQTARQRGLTTAIKEAT